MVKITKVYTRQGDDGKTSVSDKQKITKTSVRIHAMGEIDELNSSLGVACSFLPREATVVLEKILRIQNELFNLGAQLSYAKPPQDIPHIHQKNIDLLESEIDTMNHTLPILHSFVLPHGATVVTQLYLARAICRRAERATVQLAEQETLIGLEIPYLNRLSDWLFVTARFMNHEFKVGELLWNSRSV